MKNKNDLKNLLKENDFKIEVLRYASFYKEEFSERVYFTHEELDKLIQYSAPLYDMDGVKDFSIFTEIKELEGENELSDMIEFRFVDLQNKRISSTFYGDEDLTYIMKYLCSQNYKKGVVYPDVYLDLERTVYSNPDEYHQEFYERNFGIMYSRLGAFAWNYILFDEEIKTETKISLEIAFQHWKHINTLKEVNNSIELLKSALKSKGIEFSLSQIIKQLEKLK